MSRLAPYQFNVTPGRVTEVEADTIIVPGHPGHTGHGGVFGGVQQAGAIAGCEALSNWHELNRHDVPMGSVMRTPSGGGKSKYLSHVVTVCDFAHGASSNFPVVVSALAHALEDMHQAGLKTVSIPMMGTGQMGWLTPEQSARAMMIGIDRFAKRHPDAKLTINFCMKTEEHAAVMKETIAHPERYTDIADEVIVAERGQAAPEVAQFDFTAARDPLVLKLQHLQTRLSVNPRR